MSYNEYLLFNSYLITISYFIWNFKKWCSSEQSDNKDIPDFLNELIIELDLISEK